MDFCELVNEMSSSLICLCAYAKLKNLKTDVRKEAHILNPEQRRQPHCSLVASGDDILSIWMLLHLGWMLLRIGGILTAPSGLS